MTLTEHQRRIVDAVDAAFDGQLAVTKDFVAIPSTQGFEGPCQDMMHDLLRQRGYEIDDWHIDIEALRHLRGFGSVEHDFSRARTVVGTFQPATDKGRSLILQGHCDVVPPGPLDMWETPPFTPSIKDGWMTGRGAGDMKSGTIAALFALDAIKNAGLQPTARIHFQSVIEEESTGLGALSTIQRGYRADCCFIPEPTNGHLVRAQVGVIWFRICVRGRPAHVFEAGAGSNAIKAAYHLIHALEGLEDEWNERAKSDRYYASLTHPIDFNPGKIRGGDWASSVPAWCDVDCRIAVLPGWSVIKCCEEIEACINAASRQDTFLSQNRPVVKWPGFLSDGYALPDGSEPEAVLRKSHELLCGNNLQELIFTATTDIRHYGLNAGIPSVCYGATCERMHGFNERVDLESLRMTTKTIALFVADWCGIEPV